MTLKKSGFAIQPVGSHTRSTTDGAATISIPSGATGIVLQNTAPAGTASADLKYTLDGTAASATVGFLLEPGDSAVRIDSITDVKVYAESSAVIEYQAFRRL